MAGDVEPLKKMSYQLFLLLMLSSIPHVLRWVVSFDV